MRPSSRRPRDVGLYCWVVITALGLGVLVAVSEIGYLVLRIAGAIVLIGLGIQAWRASGRVAGGPAAEAVGPVPVRWRGAVTGLLTNLANPKMAVFFFAQADVLATTALLGLVHVVVDATWYLLVAGLVVEC